MQARASQALQTLTAHDGLTVSYNVSVNVTACKRNYDTSSETDPYMQEWRQAKKLTRKLLLETQLCWVEMLLLYVYFLIVLTEQLIFRRAINT